MAKVITFSRVFPSYHPRAGEPTYFVEKLHYNIWSTVSDEWMDAQSMLMDLNKHLPRAIVRSFIDSLEMELDLNNLSKGHTIRGGNRFKSGDWFSPRVWGNDVNPKSGRSGPYHSKQIIIAPDIQIPKVWDFDIAGHDGKFFINQSPFTSRGMFLSEIAKNDGLMGEDFKAWFKHPKPFSGQVICWNDSIEY